LLADSGRDSEAGLLLENTLGRFTEGFETGMQNAALAVAIIGSQFNADAGMLTIAGL